MMIPGFILAIAGVVILLALVIAYFIGKEAGAAAEARKTPEGCLLEARKALAAAENEYASLLHVCRARETIYCTESDRMHKLRRQIGSLQIEVSHYQKVVDSNS